MLEGLNNVLHRITNLQNKFVGLQNKYNLRAKQHYNVVNSELNTTNKIDTKITDSTENFEKIVSKAVDTKKNNSQNQNKSVNIDKIIQEKAEKYDISPDLIRSIIQVESNFNQNAVSHKGAKGLMQLMPSTAAELGVNNIFDAEENIEGGTKYLRQLLNMYGGDLKKSLAAYNAGMGNVQKYNGIPPFNETNRYINLVLSNLPKPGDA